MAIVSKDELLGSKEEFFEKIRNSHIFIYPTDTIYGIGCDASSEEAVSRIREIKGRAKNPFSVIVPSLEWVYDNCVVPKHAEQWLQKLPGPYTLILKMKRQNGLAKSVNPGRDTIGIRLPNHWVSGMVRELKKPVITTSVNKAGKEFMTSIDNLDPAIHSNVEFIVYEGEKQGSPSTLVDLTGKRPRLIER